MTPAEFNKWKTLNAWRESCGLPPIPAREPGTIKSMPPLDELRLTQWSPEFETMMRDRLIMGAFRYGTLGNPEKAKYDNIASCLRRLELYRETGDLGLLADVANLCLCEFVEGNHPKAHIAMGDSSEKVEKVK